MKLADFVALAIAAATAIKLSVKTRRLEERVADLEDEVSRLDDELGSRT